MQRTVIGYSDKDVKQEATHDNTHTGNLLINSELADGECVQDDGESVQADGESVQADGVIKNRSVTLSEMDKTCTKANTVSSVVSVSH